MRGYAIASSLPLMIMLLGTSCGPGAKNGAGTSPPAAETPALYARMRIEVVQTTGRYRDRRTADGDTAIEPVEEHVGAPVGADVWIAGGEQAIAMVQLPEGRRMTFLLRDVSVSPEAVRAGSRALFVNFEWGAPGVPGGAVARRGGWAESTATPADKYAFRLNRPVDIYCSDQAASDVGQEVYSMLSMRVTATLVEVRTIGQIKEDRSGPVLHMPDVRRASPRTSIEDAPGQDDILKQVRERRAREMRGEIGLRVRDTGFMFVAAGSDRC